MNTPEQMFNRRLAVMVLGSFVFCLLMVILKAGLDATPYHSTDRAGHPMGFNDPLTAEHYLIMIGNFHITDLLGGKYAYEWLLAAAHLAGAFLLLSARFSTRVTRWFFAAQTVLFPFGLLAIPIFVMMLFGYFTGGRSDREGFVDVPFLMITAQPVWVMTSIYLTFALRGEALGLSNTWKTLIRGWRGAVQGFVNAVR